MADEKLREAERLYQAYPSGTNLRLLNIIRIRNGLEPISLPVDMDSPEEAYGMYVFYGLHHIPADSVPNEELEDIIESGPTPWLYGRAILFLPEAKRVYLALCDFYEVEPEATV